MRFSSVARWGAPGMKVSWQVTGVRRDAYAQANPLAVEVEKPANERGFYINPALYGQPEEKQIEWGRFPAKMRLVKKKRVAPSNLASVKRWGGPHSRGVGWGVVRKANDSECGCNMGNRRA